MKKRKKKPKKSYSVRYPESSGLISLKARLENVEEVEALLKVELMGACSSAWAMTGLGLMKKGELSKEVG